MSSSRGGGAGSGEAAGRFSGRAWLAPGLGLLLFGYLLLRFRFVCDDAYISFRYARNLAEGLGLVYNEGVQPPVEGYSEFLWVLLTSLGMRLGLQPETVTLLLGGISGAGVVLLTARLLARHVACTPGATVAATLFLASLPSLAVWSSSGLGTAPFVLAVLVLFERVHLGEGRGALVAMLASGAAVLLRADGAYWVAAVCGPALVAGLRSRELLQRALKAAVFGAVVFGLHVAWRYSVYGDWLPNTARVKVGVSRLAAERGWMYIGGFTLVFPGVLLGLLGGLGALRERRLVLPSGLVVLATLLYCVLVGGDFMAFGRFLVPALPFVALCLGAMLGKLERAALSAPLVGLLGLPLVVLNLLPAYDVALVPREVRLGWNFRHNGPQAFRSEYQQWARMKAQAQEWRDLGRVVAHMTEPGDSIVFSAVGAIGYFSRLFVFDRNGLITREVALREPLAVPTSPGHDKTVGPTFFLKDDPTILEAHFLPAGVAPLPEGTYSGRPELLEIPAGVLGELEVAREGDRVVLVRPR